MSDLNEQIARWKSDAAANGGWPPDELDELESHLREEVDALVAAGHSEQDALSGAVARLGDPDEIRLEFAKNRVTPLWDVLALRGNGLLVALAGVAAVGLGIAAWMKRGDALLAAHLGTILFAYLVPFLLAILGAYAIFRASFLEQSEKSFRDRFAGRLRRLLAVVAVGGGVGTVLGGFWARGHLGRFWAWDPKEVGAVAVVVCATLLYLLVNRHRPGSVRLGQAGLVIGVVTFVAWFGPAAYAGQLARPLQVVLAIFLAAQLAFLAVSLFLPVRRLASS